MPTQAKRRQYGNCITGRDSLTRESYSRSKLARAGAAALATPPGRTSPSLFRDLATRLSPKNFDDREIDMSVITSPAVPRVRPHPTTAHAPTSSYCQVDLLRGVLKRNGGHHLEESCPDARANLSCLNQPFATHRHRQHTSAKSPVNDPFPFTRMRSLIRTRFGEVYKPVRSSRRVRIEANVAAG